MFRLMEQPEEFLLRVRGKEKRSHFMEGVYANPLRYFVPTGKQEELINTIADSVNDSKVPITLCTFANGTGKTTTICHLILNIIYGPQNGWFDKPLYRNFPYSFPREIWYCSEPDALTDTIIPCMLELLKLRGGWKPDKGGKHYTKKIIFENGWTLVFKSYEQEAAKYESSSEGIIICDEPMKEVLWKATRTRRRKGCLTVLVMTPLYTPPYVIDEIQKRIDEGKRGYFHVEADLYSACKKRGIRGYLDSDIVDTMGDEFDEDEKEARFYGKPMYFSSMVYPNLSRDLHFVNPKDYPLKSSYLYYHLVDPHDGRPNAEMWAAYTPEGRYIIFDELPDNKNMPFWDMHTPITIDADVEQIKFKEFQYSSFFSEPRRVMDRYFGLQTRGVYKTNTIDEYGDRGLDYEPSYKAVNRKTEIKFGHDKVRQLLRFLPDGKPGMVIWNTCFHCWSGLQHYIRKRAITKSSEDRAVADGKLVDKYKDFPDLFRFLVCADDMGYKYDKTLVVRDNLNQVGTQEPMAHIL